MGSRRKSRELAMQVLYYMDMRQDDSDEMLHRFCDNFAPHKKATPFFFRLVKGVIQAKSEIDAVIESFSDNWKLTRMSCVDRNIIRIAAYELLCCHDIPPKVAINEAIDVGKKFGTEESGAFINGILDSIRMAIKKEGINIKVSVLADETQK
jgi:N utilization substance protein B